MPSFNFVGLNSVNQSPKKFRVFIFFFFFYDEQKNIKKIYKLIYMQIRTYTLVIWPKFKLLTCGLKVGTLPTWGLLHQASVTHLYTFTVKNTKNITKT